MIIAVAGTNGSGKGEVVRYLETRSFVVLSLSDVIRAELRSRGVEESRDRMIETGRELRAEHGLGVLAERLIEQISSDRNFAIDSIRHPAEVNILRKRTPHFTLIWLDADESLRQERIRARGRAGDPASVEELRAMEQREMGSDDPGAQQLAEIRELADHRVRNAGSIAELHDSVQRILERSLFFERPGWDEYFESIARVVASRSNCVKRKVGSVVSKDRRIISTGYNGTPRGTRNCNEGGCPRCNSFAPGGTRLDECLCSHAEENAITQAAYHGVNVRAATLHTTLSPCLQCTKMIINAGLSEVVYNADYPLGDTSLSPLREAGVKVRQLTTAGGDAAASSRESDS